MADKVEIWRQNLIDEYDGAALYEGLASAEKHESRAATFRELAEGERRHAKVWVQKLTEAGVALPQERPSTRVRALVWLARRFGTRSVLPWVAQGEASDASKYARQGGDAAAMVADEQAHGVLLRELSSGAATGARGLIAAREAWHRAGRAGSLRAAVFGMNDGIISNAALVLGVAAAGAGQETVMVFVVVWKMESNGAPGVCTAAMMPQNPPCSV